MCTFAQIFDVRINKYYLAAFSAFVIWGFFSLALKPLHDYPSLDILFYRVFMATGLLLVLNLIFRRKLLKANLNLFKSLNTREKTRLVSLTIVGGFLLVFNWFLFMYAVNHVSLQSASFAYLICPIITTVLAFLILKERLGRNQWVSVGLCVLSCALLSYGDILGLVYSLVIATSFALYLISQRKNDRFDKFVVLTVQMVIATFVLLPFYPKYGGPIPSASLFYTLMTVIVVLFTIVPLFLNLYALKGLSSATVGILMYTNPLIHFFLALFYFKETVNTAQILSYALLLLSIILFTVKKKDVAQREA